MKLSKLIAKLATILNEHGDLTVLRGATDHNVFPWLDAANLERGEDGQFLVVLR